MRCSSWLLRSVIVLPGLLAYSLAPAQPTEAWRTPVYYYTHGHETSWNSVHQMGVDAAGNYYVCGDLEQHDPTDQAILCKYSSSGALLWEKGYYAPTQVGFETMSVATDSAGNSYTTGLTQPTPNAVVRQNNFLIKWDTNGNILWEVPLGGNAWQPMACTMPSGGCMVFSKVSGSAKIMLQRFSSTGSLLWTQSYGDSSDQFWDVDLAVDADGQSYIAGHSNMLSGFVLSYDANGNYLWISPCAGGPMYVKTAPGGGVITTGFSNSSPFAARYNASGLQLWFGVASTPYSMNGLSTMAVGPDGSVAVAGNVYGSVSGQYNAATFHFTNAGVADWAQTYTGPVAGYAAIRGLAIDASGNVYAGACVPTTTYNSVQNVAMIKYSPGGAQLWSHVVPVDTPYLPIRTGVIDGNGNVVMAAGFNGTSVDDTNIGLMSFAPDGTERFVTNADQTIYVPQNYTQAFAVDNAGNSYSVITSGKYYSALIRRMSLNKFDKDGVRLWHVDIGLADSYGGLAIDASGNIFVTGAQMNASFVYTNNFISKYDPNGNLLWTWLAGAPDTDPSREHTFSKVAVDSGGNAILLYYMASNWGSAQVVKLSSAGSPLWTASYGGFTCYCIAIGPSDVIGLSGTGGTGYDMSIYTRSASGQYLTGRSFYQGPTAWGSKATSLAFDSTGNIYVGGTANSNDGTNTPNATLLKFDNANHFLWSKQLTGVYAVNAVMGFDEAGGIGFGITTGGPDTGYQETAVTAKYDLDGNLLWSRPYVLSSQSQHVPLTVRVTPSGKVFNEIYTYPFSNTTSNELDVVRYEPDGTSAWPTSGGPFNQGVMQIRALGYGVSPTGNFGWDANGDLYFGADVVSNRAQPDPSAIKVNDPLRLAAITAPSILPGDQSTGGVVSLGGAAPGSGLVVTLSSDNPAIVLPSTVTVPAGQTSANFLIQGVNGSYLKIPATITARDGIKKMTLGIVVVPPDHSSFVSQTVPATMVAGQHYTVTLQFRNIGKTTWDAAHLFKIRSMKLLDNTTWGFNRIALASGPVVPGAIGTFNATVLAPVTPGNYNFQWQMIQDDIAYAFGASSTNVVVATTKAADAAQYVSRTGPLSVYAGQDFYTQNVMRNVGTNTWSGPTGYNMMSQTPANNTTWAASHAYLPSGATIVASGQGTFTALCTAPITPGTYTMQWQMNKGGTPFGDLSLLLSINVSLGPDDAQFIGQSGIPTTIAHGATFTASVTMKNLGTATWTGASYSLASVGSNAFGVSSIAATSTAQNASKTFSATFTAPATPGNYTFKMRMQHGTTKFGQISTAVTITVT